MKRREPRDVTRKTRPPVKAPTGIQEPIETMAEQLGRLVLEQAVEAIVVCDGQGRVIRASRVAQLFCDGSPLLRPFADAFPLRTDASGPFQLATVLRGETQRNVDVTLDRQGQPVSLLLNAGPLLSGQKIVGCVVTLTDFTERKRSEETMRANAARHAAILETAMDGFWLVDLQGHLLEANETYARMSGYTVPELRAMRISDLEASETDNDTATHIRKIVAQGNDRFETQHRRKDGSLLDVEVSAQYQAESGHVVAFLRAVTERKRAEEEHKKFMLGLQRSTDAIFMTDADGRITFVNPAFEKLYGFTASEALGKTPRILKAAVPHQDLHFYQQFWNALLAGQVVEREYTNQTKDGRQVEIAGSANPILDDAGKLVGFLAIQRDVTESKRTRAALERSRQDFRNVIDQTPDGITIRRGRVLLYANPAFASCLGYSDPADLAGTDIYNLTYEADRAAVLQRIEGTSATGKKERASSGTDELRLLRKDGALVTLEFSPSQLIEFDGAPAYVAVARDVTQRNRMLAQLLMSDRMASVGTLAAGVAHEINNPLAAAMMNIDLAHSEVAQLRQQELFVSNDKLADCSEMLSEARTAARRVREIVRDIKIFSHPGEDSLGPVDIHRILDSTLRMAWNEIRHRARLVKDYGKISLVDASKARLGQVFLNLVVNAAQSIPEGMAEANEIRVITRMDGGGQVVVEVRDTGLGMPPDVMKKLFTPFFTTKPVGEGTGLGLSICHRILSDLGGTIEVESEVGKGSIFRVSMPASRSDSTNTRPTAAVPTEKGTETRRGRILVVDDELTIARAAGRILSEHEVVLADSATAALERIRAGERFDVILCDLMMPDVTGMEFYDLLQDLAPECAERIIFMTGGAFTPKARAFLDRVPNARLDKPFEAATLRTIVRDRLRAS